jgi:hypothetical protein
MTLKFLALQGAPYIYMTLKFLALQGAPYIYDISRLRVNVTQQDTQKKAP